MISESGKKKILSDILSSPDFQDAQRYQKLLTYLIEKTAEGEKVKEITIAHEIFGKDSKFNPSEDPSIRVYISNLRKKLEHFFLINEGKYPCIIEIPKGQYSARFIPVKINKKSIETRKRDFIYFTPILLLLIAVIIYQWLSRSESIKPLQQPFHENPIWVEYFQSKNRPTMIVLGDYFFLFQKTGTPSGGNFVRDPRINTEEEFRTLIRTNPDLINKFVVSNFTYLRPSASWGLFESLSVLWKSPNKMDLKLASQFKWEDFQTHNIVFIGSFKTLHILKKIFPMLNLDYTTIPFQLSILDEGGDTLRNFNPHDLIGGNYQKDYGIIMKHIGPNNNVILFLMGFDEVGVIEAVKTAADPQLYKILKEKFNFDENNNPFLFRLVLEAEGIEQTGFKSEIKFFDKITPYRIKNFPSD